MEFDKPWREVPWGDKKEDLDYVKAYEPLIEGQLLRVLLHGPPGSGKSSFINSVDSTLRGKTATRAPTATSNEGSYTQEYQTYKIQKETPGSYYPFVFSDTMGIEKGSGRGVDVKNIKLILKGHVNEECKLLPGSIPTGSYYNEAPTINDRVHVLVCVVSAITSNMMDNESVNKMKEIREQARDLGIPQIAILTRIDEACPKVKKNIRNVYRSKHLREQMEKLSAILGIPMNCIFLVQNYNKETKINDDTDALIMNTMRKIIDFGSDFLYDINAKAITPRPTPPPPTSQPVSLHTSPPPPRIYHTPPFLREHQGVPLPEQQEGKKASTKTPEKQD